MLDSKEQIIIDYISIYKEVSSKQIFEDTKLSVSYATIKRILNKLISKNYITKKGQGKATKYTLSPIFNVVKPINIDDYYTKEIDKREIEKDFNFSIIKNVLSEHSVFSETELLKLNELQKTYTNNIAQLSDNEYKKELERLAIDLSWKSAQIEGNTYSLLETERLLKDKQTTSGKTQEEAIMLLNHKEAIDFLIENPNYLTPLSIAKLEDIHSILTKELSITRNIRTRRVGISGTNYQPLDNQFQIEDALNATCKIITQKKNVFEKALLALVLLSYIQPFMDGNKRTARIVSNAILLDQKHCPLSFRTVEAIDYKKAMLLFYEQNNISIFKDIFINQFEFAVNTYF